MLTRALILSTLALGASAFSLSPSLSRPLALRTRGAAVSPAGGVCMAADGAMERREALSAAVFGAAALAFGGGAAPAGAVENAKCTFASCPPPTAGLELELYEVKKSKFTGNGYSFQKPTTDTFKQVISPSSLANPGGFLFRDKLDSDTAIFADVQKVKGANTSWKPSLVESYTKSFKDKFKLIKKEGPVKTGNVDLYFFEYTVETTIAGAQEVVHFYSSFAAGADDVYVINAQTKEKDNALMGPTLEKVVKSIQVNE